MTVQSHQDKTKCKLQDISNKNNQDYVCWPSTYVVDQTPSVTENDPTPSVAIAFTSRQQLKLVFSSDSREDWIEWSNQQLYPHISARSHKQLQQPDAHQPGGRLRPVSTRARDTPGLAADAAAASEVNKPQQDAADEVSVSSKPTRLSTDKQAAVADSEQVATDSKAPAVSTTPDQSAAGAVERKGPCGSASDMYLYDVIPNVHSIIAQLDVDNAQKRAARKNLKFLLPNPLPAADHIRIVTTSEGDVFVTEKRKLPCVEYIARGVEAICPLEELPEPARFQSCCHSVPMSVVKCSHRDSGPRKSRPTTREPAAQTHQTVRFQ